MIFVWLPATLAVTYVTTWLLLKLLAFGAIRGPDAIGVGLAFAALVPAILVGAVALMVCFVSRPRKESLHPVMVGAAVVIYGSLALVFYRVERTTLMTTYAITFCDEDDHPRSGAPVAVVISESGLGVQRLGLRSDASGRVSFQLRKGQTAEVEFAQPLSVNQPWSLSPTSWTARIYPDDAIGRVKLWHLWQLSLGSGAPISESFQEFVTKGNPIAFSINVPRRCGLDSPRLVERVRAALAAGVTPEMACGNVSALECLPELTKQSAIAGLRQSARILNELESTRRKLTLTAGDSAVKFPGPVQADFLNEIAAFGRWAGTAERQPLPILRIVETKIDGYAKQLSDFALAQLPDGAGAAAIITELHGSRPFVGDELRHALVAHPPSKASAIQTWGNALFWFTELGHRREYVQDLFASDNPALVLLACEALGNQLEAEGGEFALERLRAIRADAVGKDFAGRIEMWISELEFRLRKRAP